jgi:hypothetical protein
MIGYIPVAIVIILFVTAWIRQSLYYKGCMDGALFVFTAFFAFAIGGALNLAFLVSRLIWRKWFVATLTPGQRKVEVGSVAVAALTLLFQVVVFVHFAWLKIKT